MILAVRLLLECGRKKHGSSQGALLITLSGELGTGKTNFVQALAAELGISERVTSPTFVIQKEYTITPSQAQVKLGGRPYTRLVHIDAYRLNSLADLELLGWKDLLSDDTTLIALEWPERVEGVFSYNPRFDLTFSHVSERVRNILFNEQELPC